jgi:hypothetical protein
MKALAVFTLASVLGITSAFAQSTTVIRRDSDMGSSRTVVRHGDDHDGSRARVSIRERRGADVVVHRRHRVLHTGSIEGCRTIIVKRSNAMGDRITKKIKKCG